MKSERRHELEHNALADWLMQSYEGLKRNRQSVMAGLLLVLILAGGYLLWTRYSVARAEYATYDWVAAQSESNPAKLVEVGQTYAGLNIGAASTIEAADLYRSSGCQYLFRNRATANTQLRLAEDNYRLALDATQDPGLLARATYGLAQTREALGQLETARGYYESVYTRWPKCAYAEVARRRWANLGNTETKAFYDRMAKYDPTPIMTPGTTLPGGTLPFSPDAIPQEPSAPSQPSASGETTAAPAGETKAAESTAAASDSTVPAQAAPSLTAPNDTISPPAATSSPAPAAPETTPAAPATAPADK